MDINRIETLKQRMDSLNRLRIERSMSVMRPVVKQIYPLLATFFHYHHPLLPGYLDGAIPCGISLYQPDQQQRNHLFSLGMSHDEIENSFPCSARPLLGLYSMGSTSSIGQSCNSDLDIWVCHSSTLTMPQRSALQKKCAALEQWVARLGMDISFFLMDEAYFRHQHCGCLSHDNCGSSQHFLLLDEFYRSAVRLAGRPLLWYIVPSEQEAHYDDYVQFLYQQGWLIPDQWLDLGSLNVLSAEEYFGATLWQLYKSIDSPYKAVLKTLLLEAYSWEYPDTQLISVQIKQKLHQEGTDVFTLDHYCMILDKVSHYLIKTKDRSRLDLARRCFYLKVCEKLSRPRACVGWRRQILQAKVDKWGWEADQVLTLDKRRQWKIAQVREAHNELLDAMMCSYRHLIRFARQNNLAATINPQDIGVLTRKLYATFEVLPGKVSLINPQISPDLSEPCLTFIHVSPGSANRAGWYLYNQQPIMGQISSHQPLEYNRYLNKLVAWAYFNGLLTEKTRFYLHNRSGLQLQTLQNMVQDIRKHFPLRLPAPSIKALYSPCEIRQLAIIINLEHDPTEIFNHQAGCFDFRQLDLFSFGPMQQCLIGSIDLLYRNTWNEVKTLHFSGELALLDALQTILGKMHLDAPLPEAIQVFCYSKHLSGLLHNRVQQLVTECIELRLSSSRNEQGRFKALRIAGQIWGIFFERLSVSLQKLENPVKFYGAISNNKLYGLPVNMEQDSPSLPPVVDSYANEGIIQFFFEDTSTGFTIYILDESNRVEMYQHCTGVKDELVRDINLYYTVSHDYAAFNANFGHFNLPQFYQIILSGDETKVIPYATTSLDANRLADPVPMLPAVRENVTSHNELVTSIN